MLTLLGVLCVAILLVGAPIFMALTLPPLAVVLLHTKVPSSVIMQQFWGGMDKFSLMAMPFFVYAADLMAGGGLSERLIRWMVAIVGRVRGGLGMAAQLSSMFFGAVSGSSPATVAAIGKIMYPALAEHHYPRSFRNGLIASGPAVAILIPPSITMVVYGSITGTSVGAMFIGGITAGVFYGTITLLYCVYRAWRDRMPPGKPASLLEVLQATYRAAWALGFPLIILGGIYFGVFTPTEAGAVAVVYAFLVSVLIYREMSWEKFFRITLQSAIVSAELMLLTGAASALGWVFTIAQLPDLLANTLLALSPTPFVFFLLVAVFLLLLGMFIDGVPAVVLVAPVLFPLALKLGIDPVQLGVVLTANLAVGMFAGPFGLNLFVAADIANERYDRVAIDALPFVAVGLVAVVLLSYFPELSLWLPRLVYGKG